MAELANSSFKILKPLTLLSNKNLFYFILFFLYCVLLNFMELHCDGIKLLDCILDTVIEIIMKYNLYGSCL